MEDLKRQLAIAQETANKARTEAAEAKTEAMRAKNLAVEAKREAVKGRSEADVREPVQEDDNLDNYKPPFAKIAGGLRIENEAREDEIIRHFFRNSDKVQQLAIEMEDDLREKMSNESVRTASEKLPGRVIQHLLELHLQASRSWPSECPPRTLVPKCLVTFVKDFMTKMGVEYDEGMRKRLQKILVRATFKVTKMKEPELVHNIGNRKRMNANSGKHPQGSKMIKSTHDVLHNEDSEDDLDEYERIRSDDTMDDVGNDSLNEADDDSEASSLDENAIYRLGAMDRFKVRQAAKRGKSAAKEELAAALERSEATVDAARLGTEKRKKKDKVCYQLVSLIHAYNVILSRM